MDASGRYDAALEVVRDRSDDGTRRLISMLGDDERVTTSEGMSVYDVEPTYDTVGGLAARELASRVERAWPVIVDALAGANKDQARGLLSVIWQLPVEQRMALPDDAYAKIEDAARMHGYAGEGDRARWDRDFARRMRAGEFPTPESLWRARLAHPYYPERHGAIYRLRDLVDDKVAFLRELVPLLDDRETASAVLLTINDLPRALLPETVRTLASGSLVRESELLLVHLAEYGEPARALVPLCLEKLRDKSIRQGEEWERVEAERDSRWRAATKALIALLPHLDAAQRAELETCVAEMAASKEYWERKCAEQLRAAMS
jgi:hypothetical protein